MLTVLLISLITLLGCCLGGIPHPAAVISGKVVGTVITACDNVTFHTPPGDPYPTRSGRHFWLSDSHTACLADSDAALDYCRKVYTGRYPELIVDHVIVDPFKIVPDILPWFPANLSSAIRVYLCLGPPPTNTKDANLLSNVAFSSTPKVLTDSPSVQHRLPTLIDVHRAYFAEQFRHLWNATHSNVSQVIGQLVQETKGLFKLYPSNPHWVQYSVSQMLKKAHEHLEAIWATEEREWALLEENQHEDLASQLTSEEWSGENMFAFALQESHVNVSRVQDALSALLSHLADGVSEEVRHLKSVYGRQPWMLRLDSAPTNWTNNITHGVIHLERVHQELLKHVRVATLAINAFHTVMAQDMKEHPTSRNHQRYKPTLVASYDRLQANLLEAQRLLKQAKGALLGNLATRMNSILSHLNSTISGERPILLNNVSFVDWIKSKHHAELAYIDLLVAQLLSPYVASIDLPVENDKSKFIWEPSPDPFAKPSAHDPESNSKWTRDPRFIILTVVLVSVLFLSVFLFSVVRKLRSSARSDADTKHRRMRSFLYRGGQKIKHLVGKSQQQWIAGTASVWKVGPRVVLVEPDQSATSNAPAENFHGYANPVCPAQRGNH